MKKFYTTILLCTIPLIILGQISHGGKPLSFTHNIKLKSLAVFTAPKFDYKSIIAEDLSKGLKSNRYGKVIELNLNPENSGKWQNLQNGNKLWTLAIQSKGAYSLSLIFNNYKLKNGAKIFVYSSDKQQVLGAFTEYNNKQNSWFSTVPVKGDKVIIELNTFNNDDYGDLNISGVVHDYKGVMALKSDTGYGASASCNVNVNCPEGNDWQVEKKAVAKLYVSGLLCSGTLVNNTAQDSKPYLLTAAHCVKTPQNAQTGVFVFNYESENCQQGTEPDEMSISGSNLIATGGNDLDFTLLELSTQPPDDYDVYYAGWNRSPTLTNDNFVCIHHPRGDIKKINFSKGNIEIDNYGLGFVENSHYKVKEWDIGTTEEGSSGSALFDNEHLIIGDLTGGEADCNYNYNDFYTRFDMCWDYYDEYNKQLKKWLDPINSGAVKFEGMFQNQLISDYDVAISNDPKFTRKQCLSDTIFAHFKLQNLGKKALNTVKIEGKIGGNIIYNSTWTGNLQARETVGITFPVTRHMLVNTTIVMRVYLPDDQVDANPANNVVSKNITLIQPIDGIEIRGNKHICENNKIQEYYTTSLGSYDWTVTGGTALSDTGSHDIKVKWNRWGYKQLSVKVSNYCNYDSANMEVVFVEQELTLQMNVENNYNSTYWYITNEQGDTVAGYCHLPANGNYNVKICLSKGGYTLFIHKNGANIKSYTLSKALNNQIFLNNDNIEASQIEAKFKLDKYQSEDINLYPNPAKDRISIEAYFARIYKNAQFAIFNQSGETIVPYTKFDNLKIIDISHLSKGSYIVKVKSEFGEISKKFIKL